MSASVVSESRLVRSPSPSALDSPERIQRYVTKKVGRAIADYRLIEDRDRVMVCVSGGKDSYVMLDVLIALQRKSPAKFDMIAVNVDQGWPGYQPQIIANHLAATGVPFRMIDADFAAIVAEKLSPNATPCSLCSRLRRGVLYNLAVELGCTKIALGHHMDDLIETLVLNMFYSGRLASMPPRLHADDGRNTVIRPMAYVPESALTMYAKQRDFPVVGCSCPSCGLPNQKRQVVKRLLGDLEAADAGIKQQMLAALRNVHPSHLLDTTLW